MFIYSYDEMNLCFFFFFFLNSLSVLFFSPTPSFHTNTFTSLYIPFSH